jgi:hypothetical protein
MEDRILPIKRIILAFVIATIIFFTGFLFSYSISYSKYQSILAVQDKIKYDLLALNLQGELISSSCDLFDLSSFSKELDNMGVTMAVIETRLGKNNIDVMGQKKIYSILETQHFILVQKHNSECNNSIPIILFFYSNDNEYVDNGETMGYILSTLKKETKNIMIYSFDYDLDSDLVRTLKNKYKITEPNTIVINDNIKLKDVKNIDEIEVYLNNNQTNSSAIHL